MTERLADISARIDGIQQLGAVVNAMRGIAAARAQQARGQLVAVESYAATIAAAIGQALSSASGTGLDENKTLPRSALVLFCAEQGFAGAFSERALDAASADFTDAELFLIGTRGRMIAAERNKTAIWTSAMPSHTLGIPQLADRIADALYARIATGGIDQLDVIFSRWQPGHGTHVERRQLFPMDFKELARPGNPQPPLQNLSSDILIGELTKDYVHAQLCESALHAFAAENEARMEAMAAAHSQIERQLAQLKATQRQVRQEEITAEIIELAAGETASVKRPSTG